MEKLWPPPHPLLRLLGEARYHIPNNADQAMMDLYALYAMWFYTGGGKQECGYPTTEQDAPVNDMRRRRVEDMFHTALMAQAKSLGSMLMRVIPDEFEHLYDPYLIDWVDVEAEFKQDTPLWTKIVEYQGIIDQADREKRFWKIFNVSDVSYVYSAKFWNGAKSDLFGGKQWAQITTAFGGLLEAYKRGNIKNIMYEIDKIYDIQHNTGSIMTKMPKNQRVSKEALDFRAAATGADFQTKASPVVASMISACLPKHESRTVQSTLTESDTVHKFMDMLTVNI